MVHILDTLARLETKFDNLTFSGIAGTPESYGSASRASASTLASSSDRTKQLGAEIGTPRFPTELQQGYHHLTVPHKIVLWPSIYIFLVNSGITAASDLQHVLQEGTPWFIRQEMSSHKDALDPAPGLSRFDMEIRSSGHDQLRRMAYHFLSVQRIQEYCDAYFNTFNVLTPLLNRETFMSDIVGPILQHGFGEGEPESVMVLLVLALGQVAMEGVFDQPVSTVNGTPSGFRGGSAEKPPGLEIFNEARRGVGFIATNMTLENVQIMVLQAIYFEATARHLDFWRSIVMASMACQVLVKCQKIDWQSNYGDLVKRAYWACVLSEDLYHLDLDLPQSGIQSLEDVVPLPYFHDGASTEVSNSEDRSHFQYHFLAMIALRRLISRIHETIHDGKQELFPLMPPPPLLTIDYSLFEPIRICR